MLGATVLPNTQEPPIIMYVVPFGDVEADWSFFFSDWSDWSFFFGFTQNNLDQVKRTQVFKYKNMYKTSKRNQQLQ